MTEVGKDTLATRSKLSVNGKDYTYYSFAKAAEKIGDVSRLPFSLKVLLENLLRFEDGGFTVGEEHIQAIADWQNNPVTGKEIQYRPARVLLQDFTGVPCVVDLAAMRDAIGKLGGDTAKINPQVPVNLVIDHSVMVDEFGTPKAFAKNVELEYQRNAERYDFLKWGSKSFHNFSAVPPGHRHLPPGQPRAYRPLRVVERGPRRRTGRLSRYLRRHRQPHHHDQWPGRARLGRRRDRGRGGDARPAVSMLIPEVVGFRLDRQDWPRA